MTERELAEYDERLKKIEEEGIKNILRHFDRIHDKLFAFNNILIAGYFALAKLVEEVSVLTILIPLLNLSFLFYLELRMLNKSKFEAELTKKTTGEVERWGKQIRNNNLLSMVGIVSTTLVTFLFMYYLLR